MAKSRDFAQLLHLYREQTNHMTFADLAARAGASPNYLRLLEKGVRKKPRASLVLRLAQALNLSQDQREEFYRAANVEPMVSSPMTDAIETTPTLAREFWNSPPEDRTIAHLANLLRAGRGVEVAPSVAQGVLDEWERHGWVKHTVWAGDTMELPPRNSKLEIELLTKFRIRHAMVACIPSLLSSGALGGQPHATPQNRDNQIHAWLGRMAAQLLLALLRGDDCVAVGGGRGPYECVTAAKMRVWESFPRIGVILSLTGRMNVRPWDPQPGSPRLDADDVAASLSTFLSTERGLRLCEKQLIRQSEKDELPRHLDDRNADSEEDFTPDVALIGMGALAGGHRLCSDDASAKIDLTDDTLTTLRQTAKEIDESASAIAPQYAEYHCVADLCNYLVAVDPPDKSIRDDPRWDRLNALIREINDRVVSVQPTLLARVAKEGAVIVVAGGKFKRHAIRHFLLSKKGPYVSHLVTDDETAQWLIDNTPPLPLR